MNKVTKAGCILLNLEDKTVAIVHRNKKEFPDFSFPKGHIEKGESLQECAVRETAEETKRECVLLESEPVYVESYTTPSGENVELYYFISKDIGPSDNDSTDTHPTYWLHYDEVYDKLTFQSTKAVWESVKDKVKKYLS